MKQKDLEEITNRTKIWTPNLDLILPITGSDIDGFKEWVNWSGWMGYSRFHTAYDFAAYFSEDGKVVLGLPKETPIRVIADGVVRQVSNGLAGVGVPYACFMHVEHGAKGRGLFSSYLHIDPIAKEGQKVKKGEVIGSLYKDKGSKRGRLVHLHFDLTHGVGARDRTCNPELIYPSITKYRAEPQGRRDFKILGIEDQPEIYIANFKKLLVNDEI